MGKIKNVIDSMVGNTSSEIKEECIPISASIAMSKVEDSKPDKIASKSGENVNVRALWDVPTLLPSVCQQLSEEREVINDNNENITTVCVGQSSAASIEVLQKSTSERQIFGHSELPNYHSEKIKYQKISPRDITDSQTEDVKSILEEKKSYLSQELFPESEGIFEPNNKIPHVKPSSYCSISEQKLSDIAAPDISMIMPESEEISSIDPTEYIEILSGISQNLISYQELANIPIDSNASIQNIENHLKLLQEVESQLAIYKSKVQEIENIEKHLPEVSYSSSTKEELTTMLQTTINQIEIIYEFLFIQIEETQTLFNVVQQKQNEISEPLEVQRKIENEPHQYINTLICRQENLILLIQKYFQISYTAGLTNQSLIKTTQKPVYAEATSLKRLFCKNKARSLPSNQDIYQSEARAQDSYVTSLPVSCFLPNVESEKIVFEQRLEEILGDLQQFLKCAVESGKYDDIESYYIQLFQILYQWIEFVEHCILKITVLSGHQRTEQCEIIKEELTVIQKNFHKVNQLTESISSMIPEHVKNNILPSVLDLELQINSTRQLANDSFDQISVWNKENLEIDEEFKNLHSCLLIIKKEIEEDSTYTIPEVKELKLNLIKYCNKYENLGIKKLKLSLLWPGCELENLDEAISLNHNTKLKAFQIYDKAVIVKRDIDNYRFISQSLIQLCDAFERFFKLNLCLSDKEQLNSVSSSVNNSLIFLEMISFRCQESFLLCKSYLDSGSSSLFNELKSKADNTSKLGKERIKMWQLCFMHVNELEKLLHSCSLWLREKCEVSRDHPCPKQDLPNFIAFFKDLQHEIKDHSHQIKRIKELQDKINAVISYSVLDDFIADFLVQYLEFQESVDARVCNIHLFSKQWSQFEEDLKILQKWLSESGQRIKHIQHQIKAEDNLSSLYESIRSISRLESETKSKEHFYEQVKNAVEQSISLNILHESGPSILNSINHGWNENIQNISAVKCQLFNNLKNSSFVNIVKELNLWITSIEKEFRIPSIEDVNSVYDLQQLKQELWCWKNDVLVMENICQLICDQDVEDSSLTKEEIEFIIIEQLQALKMKLVLHLEKVQLFMNKSTEFDKLSADLLHKFEIMQSRLDKINESNMMKNRYALANNMDEIQLYKQELKQDEEKFHTLQTMVPVICENIDNKDIRKNIASKCDLAEQNYLSLHSKIYTAEEAAVHNLKLWDKYHKYLDLCYQYIIEQENMLIFYDSCDLNLQHLHLNILKLHDAFQEFNANEKMLKEVIESSDAVKLYSDAGIQIELESDKDILQAKWNSLKDHFCESIDKKNKLKDEWSKYAASFESLSGWISIMQNFVINMHFNRLCTSIEYNSCLEELTKQKSALLSLREEKNGLCAKADLHELAKKNIEMSVSSFSSALMSLEEALLQCQDFVLNVLEDKHDKERRIQDIQKYLNNLELALYDVEPSGKEECQTSLITTEQTLFNISNFYADLLFMKENLILQEVSDFAVIEDIDLNLSKVQEIISRLSSYYLKLIEISVKSNSFLENCSLVMQLLSKFKTLHAMKIPNEYRSLMSYFLTSQIMEIYIHSYQIIIMEVISSDSLALSFNSQFGVQNLFSSLCEFVKECDLLETAYRMNMTLIKEKLYLWQKYLHHYYKINSSLNVIKREIAERIITSNIYEFAEETSWILEKKLVLNNHLMEMDIIESSANHLCENVNDPILKKNLRKQICEMQHRIETDLENLMFRKSMLEEMKLTFDDSVFNLRSCQERLSSVQHYTSQDIPFSFEEMKKEIKKSEVEKDLNQEVIDILETLDFDKLKNERTNAQNDLQEQKTVQSTLGHMLNLELNQRILLIHRSLNKLPEFDRKYVHLLKWCDKIKKKLNEPCLDSPTNALKNFNDIATEIDCMKSDIDEAVDMGNALSDDGKIPINVAEKVLSLKSTFLSIVQLHADRFQSLKRAIKCLENLAFDSEKLSFFLLSENEADLYLNFKDLSLEDVENQIKYIQDTENNAASLEDVASVIQNILCELDYDKNYFNMPFSQNAVQHSQNVLHRWILFKKFVTNRKLSLLKIKEIWDEFLIALKNLEEWLSCKESIASQVDYSEQSLSRNTYLEGVGVFENLKHDFQDNIQLLHSVNSLFHNISKKEIKINESLKNRVSSANDSWHKLYEKVAKTFDSVKDILQAWDNFDQQKEHLLLFLTETDLKLTEIETIEAYQKADYENIEKSFKLHYDERVKYIETSNHLMNQSNCSINSIQTSVEEVESYWDELYKRLQSLRVAHEQLVEEKQNIDLNSEVNLPSRDLSTSKEEATKESKEHDSLFSEKRISPTLISKSLGAKLKELSETDSPAIKSYSKVAAMNIRKESETTVLPEKIKGKTSKRVVEKVKILPDKTSYPTRIKPQSFDDDCIKDLLAALKEAAERMDVLENVLSEVTPTGSDERGPNFSHLLAACRSSVDVIQHLSQILFYDIPNEEEKPEKSEIRTQSEDLLQRWLKIENLAVNKESRVIENRKNYNRFTKELHGFEVWVQRALEEYSSESCTDTDIEKLVIMLQKHKELISQIHAQKNIILTLNLTGHKILSTSDDSAKILSLKQRIKTVNEHWDNLYATASLWQSKLQSEILQSTEFRSTIDEMESWLKESEKRIDEMSQMKEKKDSILHEQHTELYALKQQLEVYSDRLETLLEITLHLFLPEVQSGATPSLNELNVLEVQEKLKSNLKISQSLLIKCTEMLKSVSSLLGFSKFQEHSSLSRYEAASVSQPDRLSSNRSECCSFLMRVARASFPFQAILLLLLGAAILLPMEDEEELSCRLSNNFASSLNPMLRYPDGPPPV